MFLLLWQVQYPGLAFVCLGREAVHVTLDRNAHDAVIETNVVGQRAAA